MIFRTFFLLFIFPLLFSPLLSQASKAWSNETVDHGIYGDLLKKYVQDGRVNYGGFKKEESILDQYLKVLEEVKPDKLSDNEQFAFYIKVRYLKYDWSLNSQ